MKRTDQCGLDIGTGAGQVNVVSTNATSYTVTAYSKAETSGTRHEFEIDKGGRKVVNIVPGDAV